MEKQQEKDILAQRKVLRTIIDKGIKFTVNYTVKVRQKGLKGLLGKKVYEERKEDFIIKETTLDTLDRASEVWLRMDGGIGLQFKVGGGSLYTEAAVDRVNSGTLWQSNASVRVGYLAHLGITERDRVNVDIDRNIRTTYGELKTENQLLKSEAQKITQANEQLQSTLERATLLCEQLEKKLTDCNEATRQAELNCQNAWPSIYFEYASSFLTTIEEEKAAMIAEAINADRSDNVYMIEGYCSANGDPYRNQKLSEERAQAVFFALVANGVDSTRLFMVGNGMSDRDSALEQRVIVKKSF